jgi:hypothetical protein
MDLIFNMMWFIQVFFFNGFMRWLLFFFMFLMTFLINIVFILLFFNEVFIIFNRVRREFFFFKGYHKNLKSVFIPMKYRASKIEKIFNEICNRIYTLWIARMLDSVLLFFF